MAKRFKGCDKMKPIIGVMPLWDDEKDSIWMLPGYMDGIHQAGGIPLILPFSTEKTEIQRLAELCDGFLFTGGHDVSPVLYHEKPLDGFVSCCKMRDDMEIVYLHDAINSNKPVLGICRGIQFINAALGGTLYQDLPLQHPSDIEHHQKPPYNVPIHDVMIEKDSPLYHCLKTGTLPVNSYHHQAIKTLADNLKVMAKAPDGIIEAVYMSGHRFLWALQWHPEFSWKNDPNSMKIFKAFIEAMQND